MNRRKNNSSNIILTMMFFIGLSLLLYPSISDYWNSFHQTRAIADYSNQVAELDDHEYYETLEKAVDYNRDLLEKKNRWVLSEEEEKEYEELLDITGSGVMGSLEIPQIKVSLPIYHGVQEEVLQIAVGHIKGSSLPVGGIGTHTVLSGHRGLPSAKLLSNLDELVEGDYFILHILDETLTYEVDQIRIVDPDDLSALEIERTKDLCTLVTCTPYGINTHRLLVRGHRVDNVLGTDIRVTADALEIEPMIVAPIIAVPILLALLIWILASTRKKKKDRQ